MSDPALIRNPAVIEAAARALASATEWSSFWDGHDARQLAKAVLAAVTPLIRAQVLEEAAKVADEYDPTDLIGIAAAIRALKGQP